MRATLPQPDQRNAGRRLYGTDTFVIKPMLHSTLAMSYNRRTLAAGKPTQCKENQSRTTTKKATINANTPYNRNDEETHF